MPKLLSLIFTYLSAVTLAWAAEPPTIRFATEATYPPFVYMTSGGTLTGFDIDIAKALCVEMKANCEFNHVPWDSLIPGLRTGKFDAIHGALAVTSAREKQVDFTDSYYENTASIVGPRALQQTALTPKNLSGKVIGVQIGTTFPQYLRKTFGRTLQVKTYASIETALLDLQAGRIDLVMGDTPVLKTWLADQVIGQTYTLIGPPLHEPEQFGAGYAIAVTKGNSKLLQAFNQALAAIKANGTYQTIKKKHLG